MKNRISILAFLFLLGACNGRDAGRAEVEKLMQETLDEKVSTYRQRLAEDCQERILTEAASITDSIIVAEARLRRDTAEKPPVPPRPERPEARQPADTTPVAPLLPGRDTAAPIAPPDSNGTINR